MERLSNRLICDHHHSSERAYGALEKYQFETMATKRNLANEPEKEDITGRVYISVSYGIRTHRIEHTKSIDTLRLPTIEHMKKEMKNNKNQKQKQNKTHLCWCTLGFLVGNKLTEKSIQQA